ncbi:MAG: 5'/3'-nucleotidase SurE [Candidatus Hodarchaeota archaeon]
MHKVCLLNDDGPQSSALLELADCLSSNVEVVIVVPDGERSASGKALTLNRPLRVKERKTDNGFRIITHDGTPADSAVLADCLVDDISLFISGINAGGNLGYQSMLTSGTVGAALEAALIGYPSIAASLVVEPDEWFNNADKERDYSKMCEITSQIAMRILEKGFPSGVDVLNMNFPSINKNYSQIIVTKPARVRISNAVDKRIDPNQSPYYWLKGIHREPPKGSDAHEVLVNGNISLSPVVIEATTDTEIETVRKFMMD